MVDLIKILRIPFQILSKDKDILERLECRNYVHLNVRKFSNLYLDKECIYFFDNSRDIDLIWEYHQGYPGIYFCLLSTETRILPLLIGRKKDLFQLKDNKPNYNNIRYMNYNDAYSLYLEIYLPLLLFKYYNFITNNYNFNYLKFIDTIDDYPLLKDGFDYNLFQDWLVNIIQRI